MKSIRNKTFFVIAGLAVLAFILTYALLSGVVVPKPVVVASMDLTAGTRLTDDFLQGWNDESGALGPNFDRSPEAA